MTKDIKTILKKYDLLFDNVFEDNKDYLTEKQAEKITDILIYSENIDDKTQTQFLKCANELNALNNKNLYVVYIKCDFLYLTTFNAIKEFT